MALLIFSERGEVLDILPVDTRGASDRNGIFCRGSRERRIGLDELSLLFCCGGAFDFRGLRETLWPQTVKLNERRRPAYEGSISMTNRKVEIEIQDVREDPNDDSAYGITCEVMSSDGLVETVRVSFGEDFIKAYFRIAWHKDIAAEEHQLIGKNRDLFILWALVKLESWIDRGAKEEDKRMILTADRDLQWAQKIGSGKFRPASEPAGPNRYVYKL
ncbi:MAG: hypothetical protein A2Z83_09725 [Omnitrophica bacterium GWA2_52_8]|nr:MAG: hypothetical protein A2Z83_09725 [Omnitrophica bacterium GWA2_52_8]